MPAGAAARKASAVACDRGPTASRRSTPAMAAWAPDLLVEGLLVGAELEHVPEDGDPTARRRRREVVEGGAHRHRVGVVAVVHDDEPVGEHLALAAALAERDGHAAARLRPRGPGGGQRGEGVAAHVGARELELEVVRERVDVSAGPEGHRAHAHGHAGPDEVVVGGDDGGAPAPQPAQERRLLVGDRVDRAELLEVDGADVRHEPDVGLGDPRELGDLPRAAHRHLEDERLGALRRGQDRQRQPDLGVPVARGRHDAAVEREHRRQDVLRRRLPGRARDADHGAAQVAAPGPRERRERRERVGRGDDRAARLRVGPADERLGVLVVHQDAPGARLQRAEREAPAVGVLARAGRRRGPPARPRASR